MTMKQSALLLASLILSACVQLTPAGARVQILAENQTALITNCKSLGTITVSSEDALRNAAAGLSGDTAVMSSRDINGNRYIKGIVYNCSSPQEKSPAPIPLVTPPEQKDPESVRKSKKCREKGGVWISNQCVISIE